MTRETDRADARRRMANARREADLDAALHAYHVRTGKADDDRVSEASAALADYQSTVAAVEHAYAAALDGRGSA